MFSRVLVAVSLVLYTIDTSAAFAISPESIALQTAAIGSKLSDIRGTASEITHNVGETVQGNVNAAVETVNQASSAATASLNQAYVTGQNAVQGVVQGTQNAYNGVVERTQNAYNGARNATQNAYNGAVQATQEYVGSAVETASNALQTATNTVATPFRLIGNRLYQIIYPSNEDEIVYIPVPASSISDSGLVVPTNHHVTYTGNEHPSYAYESGGVDDFLASASEHITYIVVPDTPKEDKFSLQTVLNGATLPHFEYPEVKLPSQPIYEVNPKTGLIQFNHPAYTSLSQKASSPILPYDEREIDITNLVRNKRVMDENFLQFFR